MKSQNAIVIAMEKMNQLIDESLTGIHSIDDIKADLMKLSKAELVDMLAKNMKTVDVTVESIAQKIMETDECAWLTYDQIATAICNKKPGAKTSAKSIASYASKYPTEKGWTVVKRRSQSEIMAETLKLVNL